MPKKTASARGGAARNKPKPQKSIQLVRPDAAVKNDVAVNENDRQDESSEEETTLEAPTTKATVTASTATVSKTEVATTKKSEVESVTSQKEQDVNETPAVGAGKGSAAARLSARRQTALKPQVSRGASLITAEHYSYVKRDLIYILILAIIMFSAIIILHFVPAIGG